LSYPPPRVDKLIYRTPWFGFGFGFGFVLLLF
jgi:hypothetical protein